MKQEIPDEAIPVGEEGVVTDGVEYSGDPLAIVSGEKPQFSAYLSTWNDLGELDQSLPKVSINLSKNKKFYERGLVELSIEGKKAIVHIDVLISCIYSVYDVPNPYKAYDPNKPVIRAFGIIKEEIIPETPEVPEHKKRELLALTLEEQELLTLIPKFDGSKAIDMILSIEETEDSKKGVAGAA